ncbi:reverse transcriptase domain-containing protein [Leptolyngbya sp. 7M]|uniref:reverse transcriptase domain-containing protein n=1 Tax=Leptolyngbya sp. 7M TaxID=2812896 RepID=UPI0039773B76
MINNWKQQVLEEAGSLFEKGSEPTKVDESQQAQINALYRQIGQLKVERDFLAIPKRNGGTRVLGVPTVGEVVKRMLEPVLEPVFDENSYGYRPRRSAHDAIAVTRKRCWQYDWVVEFDIQGLFDNINHDLLMKALRHHCQCRWVLLYVERWWKAPRQEPDGTLTQRSQGTPQGGVVSPLLANLFLHDAFDAWVRREMPRVPFCRYADDGLLHCRSRRQAEYVMTRLTERFRECGLEINPDKSTIVYCKDRNRREEHEVVSFDFLGFRFRPRRCVDRGGNIHPNFPRKRRRPRHLGL